MRIAIDAMGGDFAPQNIVGGAKLALKDFKKIGKLFLVGDRESIEAEAARQGLVDPRVSIVHASQKVDMDDDAVGSVRRKRDSSISVAVDLVKKGEAEAVVSAGHTGAAVATTTIKLRLLPGVERAGIATLIPTETNLSILIDAGANLEAKPEHLLQYAIMGSVYSHHILGFSEPSVGLMSIGGEDSKGSEKTKTTFALLKNSPSLNFRGNVEGHDIFKNPVEVLVCDGFVGNIVLKSLEAIASAIFGWLKHEIQRTPIRMAGAALAKGAFKAIWNRTNSENYGGSPLLGVNGICIIAHGSSSPLAIRNAIRVAGESISHQVNPHIQEEIQKHAR